MATALSTTGAELIGFQSQLCRVSHRPHSAPPPFLYPPPPRSPLGPYSRQPLDGDHGRAAAMPLQSCRCKYRLYCIFRMRLASLNSVLRGFVGFVRDTRGGERRYSRIIKDSPGRTDAKINKPAVMNEAGSLESSQIYPMLIVTEIQASPSGQIC